VLLNALREHGFQDALKKMAEALGTAKKVKLSL
jgi:hypothetical protein